MKILSHRGYWKSEKEKNNRAAFERSFDMGFGIETDLRDHSGTIVISHDMPVGNEIKFQELLDLASEFNCQRKSLTLALNIKADGLQRKIACMMAQHKTIEYFVFDMSIPDMRLYVENGLPTYTRISDIEKHPALFDESKGIWLDNFSKETWFSEGDIAGLLSKKKVCIVSSELHNNDPMALWEMLVPICCDDNLSLCTDNPEQAFEFFRVSHEKHKKN